MDRDHYHGMTDAQLAEWHQLTTRVERLNALLLEEQKKVTFLNNQLANEHQKYAEMSDAVGEEIDGLKQELQAALDAGLKARNKLLHLCENLPPVLGDWLGGYAPISDDALTPEYRERRAWVRALLMQMGIEGI